MPTAKRTRTFPILDRKFGFRDWLIAFLYRTFGYTPSYVGKTDGRFGNYYRSYFNEKTGRRFLQDKEYGHLWEIK